MIAYYKLFDLMNRRGIKKSRLRELMSPTTLNKITKNETIRTDTINKICMFLDCQPGDIMEYIPNKVE